MRLLCSRHIACTLLLYLWILTDKWILYWICLYFHNLCKTPRISNNIKLIESGSVFYQGIIYRQHLEHFHLCVEFPYTMIKYHCLLYRVIWNSRMWRFLFLLLKLLIPSHRWFCFLPRTVFLRSPLNYLVRMWIPCITGILHYLTHLVLRHIPFIIWSRWPSPSLLTMVDQMWLWNLTI